ncbi:metal-sensitive transcriptional regulator [Lolliginicoccus levis]|uniref:metal-sensitive transcriptional regulator n=1 Tax=Lolliginicoccus levis TaxID=2919542 RepID=UPI00241E186D|nr:metal-sensitive transcriptional regulator [Lolliginicoccus levis]
MTTPNPPSASADASETHLAQAGTACQDGHHHGYISSKDNYLKRLRRIEGQARGIQRMVEEEKYCIDILTQVSAMTSALRSVALGLLDDHMSHCVAEAVAAGGDEADAKLQEVSDAIARLVRS